MEKLSRSIQFLRGYRDSPNSLRLQRRVSSSVPRIVTEVTADTKTPTMEAVALEREFMKHPDIEEAERCWKEAALALRQAQAAHLASATDATAAAMAQAELAVEKREANWEAAIMQHGIPDDGVQFSVATQFLFQDGPKSGCR
jgi:hypothetical protein